MSMVVNFGLGANGVYAQIGWRRHNDLKVWTFSMIRFAITYRYCAGLMIGERRAVKKGGVTRPTLSVYIQWVEGLFSTPCLMVGLLGRVARFNFVRLEKTDASGHESEKPSADIPR